MSRLSLSFLVLAFVCSAALPVAAQEAEVSTPAHVSAVEGAAVLEREGRGEELTLGMPLLEGDRLRTEVGRAEVLLPDGSVLALDRHTTVDLLAGGLVRLADGRLVFVVASASPGVAGRDYQVDAPGGAVRMAVPGEYRISTLDSPGRAAVTVAVVRGQATLAGDRGSVVVYAGERSLASMGDHPEAPVRFNSAQPDAFYAWAEDRRAERVGTRSTPYLPEELRDYGGTFDRYGTWQEAPEPGIGWVWYPRVAVGWRPYYYGSWRSFPSWGWTWIGYDPWAWPTHHYGRWGFGIGGWYWIPARRWGPAWVAWGGAPGYAAWCPLGYWDRPVFSFGFSIFGGRRYSAWDGWSVVPYRAFSRPFRVSSYALDAHRLPAGTRGAFAVHHQSPARVGGTAVPRSWVSAGTAVPRGGGVRGAGAGGPLPGTFADRGSAPRAVPGASARGFGAPGARVSPGGTARGLAPSAGAARPRTGTPAFGGSDRPPQAGSASRAVPRSNGASPFGGASRPSYGTSRPSFQSSGPSGNASRPSFSAPAPSTGASRPSYGGARPSYGTSRPSFQSSRPSGNTSRPSFSAPAPSRPSYGGARPSYGPSGPASSASRPSYAPSRPSYGAGAPSFGGSRPSFGGARPSTGASRPSYGGAAPRGSSGAVPPRASSGFSAPRASGGSAPRASGGSGPRVSGGAPGGGTRSAPGGARRR